MTQESNAKSGQPVQFGVYKGQMPQYKGMTTQSLYVPMRDGVRLAVDVVLPKGLPADVRIPALLSQTRYWRAMEVRAPFKWFLKPETLDPHFGQFQPFFTSHGYALILVDVRGTGASFGTWPHPWSDESIEDAREIVDWIVSQPWSDGNVGAWGISYLGTTAELLTVLNHPAIRAVIPMFNHPDAYTDIAFPGGIFDRRFIEAWGHFDLILDQNIVPEEFGFMGRLVMKGVKPVDEDHDRKMLEAAVRDHRANGSAYDLASAAECRDDKFKDSDLSIDSITIHHFKKEVTHSPTVTCGWVSWMDAGTADAAIGVF